MIRYLFFSMLLICCAPLHAYEERDLLQNKANLSRLSDILIKDHKWVSYPEYQDRNGWNDLLGIQKDYCIELGEKYLDYQWKVVKATDYLEFSQNGNRSNMESIYNDNINAISSLFIAELAEGKGRFINPLANGVFHTCEMTTWAISAHLKLQRVEGSFPAKDDHVIELVSGDVGSMFSWIYYFLHQEFDKLTPLISERLYDEIDSRILTPYLDETRFWWMATDADKNNAFVNNWNPWCNSNVLQCFLLLEKDPERLAKGVYKTMISVDKFLNYVKEDGACEEGPSYWGHAAGKMYDYLQLLYDATNGSISLFSEPMIKNMGEYISKSYVGNGWVVNFADASAKGDFNYRLIYRFGKMVESSEMKHFASYLKKSYPKSISIRRDMYRILADLSCDKEIESASFTLLDNSFTWYPETQFYYSKNQGLFFAAKGGYNDESHNHNDIGTFSLYVDANPVFIDVGVGTYTKKTFSGERYSIWTMQSDYHNLPKINGYSQSYGKKYRAKVLKAANNIFSLDIAGGYPKEAGIKEWSRIHKITNRTINIEDKFEIINPSKPNQLNFMTYGKVDLSKQGEVQILVNDKIFKLLYNKNQFTSYIETIELDDSRLSNVWGDKIYRISLNATTISAKGVYKIVIKSQD